MPKPTKEEPETPVIEINIGPLLAQVRDKDRLACVSVLMDGLKEDGYIAAIRNLVNAPWYDDDGEPRETISLPPRTWDVLLDAAQDQIDDGTTEEIQEKAGAAVDLERELAGKHGRPPFREWDAD